MNAHEFAPVVIVGTGRCGSTLLHRVLAEHERLAWLSPYNEVAPGVPMLSVLSNLYRLPIAPRIRSRKAFPKPYEAYRFWEHYLPGFSRRDRPLVADDVPADGAAAARRAVARAVRAQRGDRLLVKVTGWSRIGYFDRLFPRARFIHLRRDPRSVVSSWIQAGWLDVTSPPDGPNWEWGDVPDTYIAAWHDLGADPILSAAVKIRLDLDDIDRNRALVPGRLDETSYENLVSAPESTLDDLLTRQGLEFSSAFQRRLARIGFYDSRGLWRRHLSNEDGDRILEFMRRADRAAEEGNVHDLARSEAGAKGKVNPGGGASASESVP